ncbi:Hypothetical protein CINCED_3A007585, partial [Cinara cedri]
MDIDRTKIKLARHNAGVYGCAENVRFLYRTEWSTGKCSGHVAPVAPQYLRLDSYSPSVLCEAYGGGEAIVRIAKSMAPKLALHLPRTVDKSE